MNYKRLISQIPLTCLTVLFVQNMNSPAAKAEWLRPLYAGQHGWTSWTLNPGDYVLEASTLLNLGDVDIEIYDTTGQMFAKGNKLGGETIFFNVPQGAEGMFKVKYKMPFCINPAGACPVNVTISNR